SNISLAELHHVLQRAMGWQDAHLHQFRVGNTTYAPARPADLDLGPRPKDEARARLAAVAPAGSRLAYEYDFGDGWEHTIEVEKVRPVSHGDAYPQCIAGERACPPEDCGGVWGYAELLDTLESGDGDESDELLEWLEDEFDPDHLDLDIVNAMLSPARV
ncbi:MAG: plasmid pRiA4b ORF-3 family protein, partial [Actinobacteria bacterium]